MPLAPSEGLFRPVLNRLSIVLVALAVILGVGGLAIARSNAALAQQPAAAAPAAELTPVSLVDFGRYRRPRASGRRLAKEDPPLLQM